MQYVAIVTKYIAIGNHINDINVNAYIVEFVLLAYQFLLVIDDLLEINHHINQLMIFVHVSKHCLIID